MLPLSKSLLECPEIIIFGCQPLTDHIYFLLFDIYITKDFLKTLLSIIRDHLTLLKPNTLKNNSRCSLLGPWTIPRDFYR